jgi:hypothetical protein
MSRNTLSLQNTRSVNNPFKLGTFSRTSLRYLTGKLGARNRVIKDGYGEGEYNHWFEISITEPAWIIAIKDGPRPKHINIGAFDLNRNPIEGRSIFDADSVAIENTVGKFYPYLGTVMGAQSSIENNFNRLRLDRGDERYFPLAPGAYLLCVSATRHELIDYGVGLVVEFPSTFVLIALEDGDGSLLTTESELDLTNTIEITSPVAIVLVIPTGSNAFTNDECIIQAGASVEIPENSTWLITSLPPGAAPTFPFEAEVGDPLYFDTIHDHSLIEWREAWETDHQDSDRFPAVFIPYTTQS